MAFNQGLQSIGNATIDVTVVFDVAFTAAPDIIVPVVENTSNDSVIYAISAQVTSKSSTGFVVHLSSATPSANYKLAWIAGSAAIIYQGITLAGRKTSQLPLPVNALTDDDYFAFTTVSPLPVTRRLRLASLKALFPSVSSVPASPASAGTAGNIAVDNNYVYTFDGTLWGRSPRRVASWDQSETTGQELRGQASLTSGVRTVNVSYSSPFAAEPAVLFSFKNTTTGSRQLISGLQTSGSASGFTVTLNTSPDSSNYVIVWSASAA